MCGIVGIIASPDVSPGQLHSNLERGVRLLRHRGPDGCGTWIGHGIALGHTRLSIIDLSDTGTQPMQDPSGRWTIVYNGEVYNYIELRDELRARGHRFRGSSDTEVVLAALIEWGPAALDRFNGMWALALWDADRQELFLARDRAGKKPLYFARLPDGTRAFSSEITPLLRMGARRRVHRQAAFDFLTQGTYGHLGARTFFEDIEQLPAAHYAFIRHGVMSEPRRYWDLPDVPDKDRVPYDEAFRSRFRELMTDAVRVRLRSDVAVGATLSGGLDSSTIVLLMDALSGGTPLHLFTSLYPGSRHDESPFFDAVAQRLASPVLHRSEPDPARWRDDLLEVLAHQEEPFGDTSILAHFALMREARSNGVPVILSGQGGDELLLGYPSMVNAYLGYLLSQGNLLALRDAWRYAPGVGMSRAAAIRNVVGAALPLGVRDRIRQRFVVRMAARVTPSLLASVSLRRFVADGRDMLSSYLRQVFTRFAIPHLTHYDDRNAMAFGVEGRMPFLDVRLIELMGTVRRDAMFAEGFTKRVLRESFADVLPESVRTRRDKVGFHTPLAHWLQQHDPWIREFMSHERIAAAGLVDPMSYFDALDALRRGSQGAALEIWRGFILHLWLDTFGLSVSEREARAA